MILVMSQADGDFLVMSFGKPFTDFGGADWSLNL